MKTANDNIISQQPAKLKARLEAMEAFQQAIQQGRLSDNPEANNYAGKYMYMGLSPNGQYDTFKNITTRKYDV